MHVCVSFSYQAFTVVIYFGERVHLFKNSLLLGSCFVSHAIMLFRNMEIQVGLNSNITFPLYGLTHCYFRSHFSLSKGIVKRTVPFLAPFSTLRL